MSTVVVPPGLQAAVDAMERSVSGSTPTLLEFRRDMHAHPELGRAEVRATERIVRALREAGRDPVVLPGGTGLWCDVGTGPDVVALRADIDALPIEDLKTQTACRSTVPGVCHACGHDVHTAAVLGAGLALCDLDRAGLLAGRVRLVFEPAEEANPPGSPDVVAAGGLRDVRQIFALHCDPRLDVGQVGLRTGPLTGSSDHVRVWVEGPGGHTARPHLTGDVVYALAKIITDLPAVLSRRVDPRSALSVVWGHVESGQAANVIPRQGFAEGTVRSLDRGAWESAADLVTACIVSIAEAYAVEVRVEYRRGVPPVVNDARSIDTFRRAAADVVCAEVVEVEQSLGGESFAWYLEQAPGALARLGVRPVGAVSAGDLHQGDFDADEASVPMGARLLAATALVAVADLADLR